MQLEGITCRHMELTPEMEEFVLRRIEKLAKIVQRMKPATIHIEMGEPTAHRRKGAQMFFANLYAKVEDKEFYSNKTDVTVFKAVEKARVDMYRQIMTWKKKDRTQQRTVGASIKKLLRFDPDRK